MCAVCYQSPCHPSCPNAPEPVPVRKCCKCKEGIFEEEKFYDSENGAVCNDCLSDMTVEEILELVGEEMSIAKKEEW